MANDDAAKLKFMDTLCGRKVRAHRILTVKPQYSDTPGWGFILDEAEYDPHETEPCDGVGRVGNWYREGVTVVCFIAGYDIPLPTCAFARVEDLEVTDNPLKYPLNDGLAFR